ncbi:MAG: hypothetical protein JO333_12535, partial [Verrucomicrobia bacterium]|nr:hypothetical protein [Verrucomicrobiota bacterium]
SAATVAAILYGNVLTTAIAHTLDVDRYRTGYMPALLVTLVIMMTFLLHLALVVCRPPPEN